MKLEETLARSEPVGLTVPVARTRILGLDALRGANIAAMVVVHYIIVYYPQPSTPFADALYRLSAYVGPLFLFVSGAGIAFFFQKHSASTLLRRGLFLFALATLVSIVFKGRFELEWTLIQDMGFAFILLAGIGLLTRRRLFAAVLLYLLAASIIIGLDIRIDGVFPIFPFITYFLVGFAYAQVCPTGNCETSRPMLVLAAPLVAFCVMGLASVLARGTRLDWLADLSFKAGVYMMLYYAFIWLLRHWAWQDPLGEYFLLLGRVSLTAYYFQQFVLRGLLKVQFQTVIFDPLLSYVLLTALVSAALWAVLRLWQVWDFAFTLEWWIRRL